MSLCNSINPASSCQISSSRCSSCQIRVQWVLLGCKATTDVVDVSKLTSWHPCTWRPRNSSGENENCGCSTNHCTVVQCACCPPKKFVRKKNFNGIKFLKSANCCQLVSKFQETACPTFLSEQQIFATSNCEIGFRSPVLRLALLVRGRHFLQKHANMQFDTDKLSQEHFCIEMRLRTELDLQWADLTIDTLHFKPGLILQTFWPILLSYCLINFPNYIL